MTIKSDVWFMISLYLNSFDLYKNSLVFKKLKFLVESFRRYGRHFQLSNKLISTIKWSFILDKQFQKFYLRMLDFDEHFKHYINFNSKHFSSYLFYK